MALATFDVGGVGVGVVLGVVLCETVTVANVAVVVGATVVAVTAVVLASVEVLVAFGVDRERAGPDDPHAPVTPTIVRSATHRRRTRRTPS